MDAKQYLVEWIERYLKNRDLMIRRIKKVEIKDAIVRVEQSDKIINYYVEPFVADLAVVITKLEQDETEHKGIVMYNTQQNFKELLKNWQKISQVKNLVVYFVNPFSRLEKKWVLFPMTHALIGDNSSIKEGLNSLFLTVEETTEEEVSKIVKE